MWHRSKLDGILVLSAIGILALELLFVSLRFDAGLLLRNSNLSIWQSYFGYFGSLAKILVVAVFILLYICKSRLNLIWHQLLAQFSRPRFFIALTLQLLCYLGLLYCSTRIFSKPELADDTPAFLYLAWLAFVVATAACWVSCVTNWNHLRTVLAAEQKALALTAVTTGIVWALALLSQEMWRFLSVINLVEGTFIISHFLLGFFDNSLIYMDSTNKLLGLGDFTVQIAPECSGYEGIGLILAFTLLYLYLNRNDLRFPRALLLLPVGAIAIWLLNSVRITALVIIGHTWSPEVAVGGFHSQAGWITFIITSLGVLWLADHSGLLRKPVELGTRVEPVPASLNLPIATLLPLVALLATTLLSTAFISGFDVLYPIRVVVVAIAISKVWPLLHLRPYRLSWEAPFAGVLVCVLWILLLGTNPEANTAFMSGLVDLPGYWALAWLAFRFIGSAVTVPIAEELAFRAYLLCKLARADVTTRGDVSAHGNRLIVVSSVVISSLAFGALHGAWIAGTVAGVVYALVRIRTRHVGDAILAHAITNGLLCAYAAMTGEWSVL